MKKLLDNSSHLVYQLMTVLNPHMYPSYKTRYTHHCTVNQIAAHQEDKGR